MINQLGFLRRLFVRCLAVSVLAFTMTSVVFAQSSSSSTSGAIRGTVIDATGRPIENAEVSVRQLQIVTASSDAGRFTFAGVKPGKYTVDVRSIGYESASARLTVTDSVVSVSFTLKRVTFSLPARVTTASRGGLSGIVADTGYRALADATVRVIGVADQTVTDSAGAFFLPLLPGRYLVRLERKGYARQLIGVTIPATEGRQIAAWMMPSKSSGNPQVGANLFDMGKRLLGAEMVSSSGASARPLGGPAASRNFSREDIDRLGYRDLLTFVRATAGVPVPSDCMAYINGGPRKDPMWRMMLLDVEFIEVIQQPVMRGLSGPTHGTSAQQADARLTEVTSPAGRCPVQLYVWLRQ